MNYRRLISPMVAMMVLLAVVAVAWSQTEPPKKPVGVVQKVEIVDYKVEPGDTLWDLGQRFYGDPWTWPMIWELNPEVPDPHWIYPGQILKVRVERGVTVYGETPKPVQPDLFEPPTAMAFDTTFSYDTRINRIDLISEEMMEGAGRIIDHIDDQVLLPENHYVYFTMQKTANVQLGDVYTIFRTQERIDHPMQSGPAGYLINMLGEIETVDSTTLPNGKVVYTGKIIDSTAEIVIGDRLMVMDRSPVRIKLKMTDLEMTGTIIHSTADRDMLLATGHIAYIDLGLKHGVNVGNSFSVWRRSKREQDLPGYKIGNIIVLRVNDKTSTVLVTNATREMLVGDMVISDVQ